MLDLGSLARELREALQQQAAVAHRLDKLCEKLEREALVTGASGTECPYESIVAEWNLRCAKVGMKKRNTPGETKHAMLVAWRKYPNLDTWRAALDACARNKWWRGEGDWLGNLESFLRPKNYSKFFDEALAAAAPSPGDDPLTLLDEGNRVEDEIDRMLANKSMPLPSGFNGRDPRDVRGKDDAEFQRRLAALQTWMENDWRYA